MKKLVLFITVLTGLLFTACKWDSNKNIDVNQGIAKISISSSERTISPVDWNIGSVDEWTVTFEPTTDGLSTITENILNASSGDFIIPCGEYNVSVEGRDSGDNYTLYGKEESVTISTSENPINIYVGLKKEGESGGFECTVTVIDENTDDAIITAALIPQDDGDSIELEIEKDGECFTLRTIDVPPSGFYNLMITYILPYSGVEYSYTLDIGNDVVELADGMMTSCEKEVNFYKSEPIFYATYNKEKGAGNNGFSSSTPMYFYDLLTKISEIETVKSAFISIADKTAPNSSKGWNYFELDLSQDIATGKYIKVGKHNITLNPDGTISGIDKNGFSVAFSYKDATSENSKVGKIECAYEGFNVYLNDGTSYSLGQVPNTFLSNNCKIKTIIEDTTSYFNESYCTYSIDKAKTKSFVSASDSEGNVWTSLYDETLDEDFKTRKMYVCPDLTTKTEVEVSASYDGDSLISDKFFLHSNEADVSFSVDSVDSIKWFNIDKKIIGDTNDITVSLADVTKNDEFTCLVYSGNTVNSVGKFKLKIFIDDGLYIDSENNYYVYFNGSQLRKGRGLWMADTQNQKGYLEKKKLETGNSEFNVDNLSTDQKKIYDTLPPYAVFANDYVNSYTFEGSTLRDSKGAEFRTFTVDYNIDEDYFYNETLGIRLEKYEETVQWYKGSYEDGNGFKGLTSYIDQPYYVVTGETNSEEKYSGACYSNLEAAVSAVNSSDSFPILFIEKNIDVQADDEGCGYSSYVEFTRSAFVYGKKGETTYTINSSAANLRVFDTALGNSCRFYISNINLIGGDVGTANGGVISLNGSSGSKITIYDGVTISGGKAQNGGGIYISSSYLSSLSLYGNIVISDNTATSYGGGIYYYDISAYGGTLSINEGVKIGIEGHGNTAVKGGGIYTAGRCYTEIYGGAISYNTATEAGGGVYSTSNNSILMLDGQINYNNNLGLYSTNVPDIRGGEIINNTDGNIEFYTAADDLSSALSSLPVNTADIPYKIVIASITAYNEDNTNYDLSSIKTDLVENPDKYVDLNFTGVSGSYFKNIAAETFKDSKNIVSVAFPSTLTSIGDAAFSGCTNLKSLSFAGDTPPDLGENAFEDCSDLSIDCSENFKSDASIKYNTANPTGIYSICLHDDTYVSMGHYPFVKTLLPDDQVPKGLVTYYDMDYAYVVNLCEGDTYPEYQWCSSVAPIYTEVTDLKGSYYSGDQDGSDNMSILLNLIGEDGFANCPAFNAAQQFGEGWYIPTVTEIYTVFCIDSKLETINKYINRLGPDYAQVSGAFLSSNQSSENANDYYTFNTSIGDASGVDEVLKKMPSKTCFIKKIEF